jgi:menaquinone-dependent protoporphyrinogen oxidase
MDKVLVAYASKYGATKEIAEKIGQLLHDNGLDVDVLSVKQVDKLEPYGAVVLGSAAYIGQWRKEASRFLKDNMNTLAEKPTWLFSSGPTGEGDAVELMKGWRYPGRLQQSIDRIKPRDITVFHGVLKSEKMNFLEKWMIKNVKSPLGDFRDWEAITKWAENIAEELKK